MTDAITFADLQKACEREAGFRRRVYPTWVEQGRYTRTKAEREIALMEAAADHFRQLADAEEAKGRLL